MNDSEQNEKRSSRSRFLRQIGVTLAAAVGAGALAARASAFPGQCCLEVDRCLDECEPGKRYCWCDCTGIGQSYCMTFADGCRAEGCTICPC